MSSGRLPPAIPEWHFDKLFSDHILLEIHKHQHKHTLFHLWKEKSHTRIDFTGSIFANSIRWWTLNWLALCFFIWFALLVKIRLLFQVHFTIRMDSKYNLLHKRKFPFWLFDSFLSHFSQKRERNGKPSENEKDFWMFVVSGSKGEYKYFIIYWIYVYTLTEGFSLCTDWRNTKNHFSHILLGNHFKLQQP